MGTMTAQILIGENHPYEGGIVNLSHTLSLSENGVPRWTIRGNHFRPSKADFKPVGWIPTFESMLEDGLLMISLYALNDPKLISLSEEVFKKPIYDVTSLYEEISPSDLQKLHIANREILSGKKLVINVFNGSSINRHLRQLKYYSHLELEVCRSVFSKHYSLWSKQFVTEGFL
jgi:hypothetical protein